MRTVVSILLMVLAVWVIQYRDPFSEWKDHPTYPENRTYTNRDEAQWDVEFLQNQYPFRKYRIVPREK